MRNSDVGSRHRDFRVRTRSSRRVALKSVSSDEVSAPQSVRYDVKRGGSSAAAAADREARGYGYGRRCHNNCAEHRAR